MFVYSTMDSLFSPHFGESFFYERNWWESTLIRMKRVCVIIVITVNILSLHCCCVFVVLFVPLLFLFSINSLFTGYIRYDVGVSRFPIAHFFPLLLLLASAHLFFLENNSTFFGICQMAFFMKHQFCPVWCIYAWDPESRYIENHIIHR